MKDKLSLRVKLSFVALLIMVMVAALTYWIARYYAGHTVGQTYDRQLTGAALQIAEHIRLRGGRVAVDLPETAFETLTLARNDRVFYRITGEDGEHISGYQGLPDPPQQVEHKERITIKKGRSLQLFNAYFSGESVRFLTLNKHLLDGVNIEHVTIQIGQTINERREVANSISVEIVQFAVLIYLSALVIYIIGIWMVLSPMGELNKALAVRCPLDLRRLEVEVPEEIQPLLNNINRFMAQLDTTLKHLKRFTSEVAHQIRNPLAGIRSQVQNALTEEDELVRNQQLNRALEACDQLNDTVTQLLNRARLAHRFQRQKVSVIALDEVTKSVCRDLAVPAMRQGVEVAYLGECRAAIRGDTFAIRQMISNLLENAIKYSPEGALVEVDLAPDTKGHSSGYQLVVRDSGPGIPDSEKEQVFQRFYRADEEGVNGSGLGLTIAREVAVHHKADLELRDNQPQGLEVVTTFPGVGV